MASKEQIVLSLCNTKEEAQCPIVTISEDEVHIKDDFGGEIRLTQGQFKLLLAKGGDVSEG